MKKIHLALPVVAAAMCACSQASAPTVEGVIADAADTTVYVEVPVLNNWHVADSARIGSDGKYSITLAEAPATPSVYRLRLGNSMIYFPVDSIETVTINSSARNFDRHYSIAGNVYARGFVEIDSLVAAAIDAKGPQGALTDPELKKQVSRIINVDTTALVSYYAIGKFIGGKPLYSYADRNDVRIMANAANNYARFRPNDPRAEELKARWLEGRRYNGQMPQNARQMEATISSRPSVNIVRYDRNGQQHDFNKVVSRGAPTLLSFTRYDGENSPANTVALTRVYNKYKGSGLQIFQVSYQPDEIAWKRAAANMPWIAVWNSPSDDVDALLAYNADPVRGNPVTFVFNSDGELVARVSDPADLDAAVAKVF